jgi:Cys-rich protein (TIGR01571 family)
MMSFICMLTLSLALFTQPLYALQAHSRDVLADAEGTAYALQAHSSGFLAGSEERAYALQAHASGFLAPRLAGSQETSVGIEGMVFPSLNFVMAMPWCSKTCLLQHDGNGDPVVDPAFSWRGYIFELFMSWVIWFSLMLCVYFCCYHYQCPVPQRKEDAGADPKAHQRLEEIFNAGHFQCMQDSNICICSFCCFGLRWADTISLAGFLSFWTALCCISAMAFLNAATTYVMVGFFTTLLMLYFRHQLRTKLGVESWSLSTCCFDFFYLCCCPCCAIAQEARIVKEAIEAGEEAFVPAP